MQCIFTASNLANIVVLSIGLPAFSCYFLHLHTVHCIYRNKHRYKCTWTWPPSASPAWWITVDVTLACSLQHKCITVTSVSVILLNSLSSTTPNMLSTSLKSYLDQCRPEALADASLTKLTANQQQCCLIIMSPLRRHIFVCFKVKSAFWGFLFGPSSVKRGRTNIVLGWNMYCASTSTYPENLGSGGLLPAELGGRVCLFVFFVCPSRYNARHRKPRRCVLRIELGGNGHKHPGQF